MHVDDVVEKQVPDVVSQQLVPPLLTGGQVLAQSLSDLQPVAHVVPPPDAVPLKLPFPLEVPPPDEE